jgi:hypothetical protein
MALPTERIRASKGAYLSSILFFTPPPVFADACEVAAAVQEGRLMLTSEERDWAFELFADAVFEETDEKINGEKVPTLLCKFSKAGRRDDPCKLHFGSEEQRGRWKAALEAARDAAGRS